MKEDRISQEMVGKEINRRVSLIKDGWEKRGPHMGKRFASPGDLMEALQTLTECGFRMERVTPAGSMDDKTTLVVKPMYHQRLMAMMEGRHSELG
jgi:hypothetical protein